MSIIIPERLSKKLKEEETWYSNVVNVINNVKDIFSKGPYFFEEYTDHGVKHINHVLEISDKLIPDVTLNTITPKALGMYLISAILHDIGMYITYDNLSAIIKDKNLKILLLDKYSMKELWDKYLVELKRYTGTELNRKFGTTEICFDSLPDFSKMTTIDKLVVGEFIRQNHHKLSHYIINDIFNIGGSDILKDVKVKDNEKDLMGLIARSHGANLRDLEEYLDNEYSDLETPNGIEVFYLMSLIRLADYLDAGEERASHIIQEMYVKHSDISKDEFAWNQCIEYENYNWKLDCQKVVIEAFPKNGSCFSKVTKWIKSVQQELDLCWAVISEFYNVNETKLSIRRIDCNITKDKVIEKTKNKFYPDEVKFQVNPDILKLLIQPLYGDDPSYGVRELVQNAVDASREREEIEKQKGKSYSGEIKVNVDTTSKTFTIEDNGTGMTVDTIINYYLKAGSSYRRSSTWGEDFFDADGNPKVLRNGKFGIGVLATFLLGAEATIITKSIKDDKCWKFTIELDQDNIEITRTDEKDTYGTIVSVKLSDEAIIKLIKEDNNYDCWYKWYVDSNPTIEYKFDGQIKERDIIDPINEGWFELEQDEYEKYYWRYDYDYGMKSYCNGIGIPGGYLSLISDGDSILEVPDIYTLDKKGIMPVNLSRNKLTEIPCRYLLLEECFKYYLAQVLKLSADDIICSKNSPRYLFSLEFQYDEIGRVHSFIYTKNGFYPICINFRKYMDVKKYQVLYTRSADDINLDELTEGLSVILSDMEDVNELRTNKCLDFIQSIIEIDNRRTCIYINKRLFFYLKIENVLSQNPWLFSKINIQEKDDYYVLTKKDDDNYYETDLDVKAIIVEYHEEYPDDESDNSVENNIMMKVLNEYFPKDTWIPYDMEERKRVFAKAFDELKKYM